MGIKSKSESYQNEKPNSAYGTSLRLISFFKAHKQSVFIFTCIVVLLIPIIVNTLLYVPIPTSQFLNASDWLGFWGSYLGGIAGTSAALIALYATHKQAERHHKDDLENRRLNVMPYIDLRYLPFLSEDKEKIKNADWIGAFNDEKGFNVIFSTSFEEKIAFKEEHWLNTVSIYFEITNIGLGPAADITMRIDDFYYMLNGFGIGATKSFFLFWFIPIDAEYPVHRTIAISCADIFGNKYEQQLSVTFEGNQKASFEPLSSPILISHSAAPTAKTGS